MSIKFELLEEFTGTRTNEMPDPENEGENQTTVETNIRDIKVRFTCEDSGCVHERNVNVVLVNGVYDLDLTVERIQEVAEGVKHKMACGVITPPEPVVEPEEV